MRRFSVAKADEPEPQIAAGEAEDGRMANPPS